MVIGSWDCPGKARAVHTKHHTGTNLCVCERWHEIFKSMHITPVQNVAQKGKHKAILIIDQDNQ